MMIEIGEVATPLFTLLHLNIHAKGQVALKVDSQEVSAGLKEVEDVTQSRFLIHYPVQQKN